MIRTIILRDYKGTPTHNRLVRKQTVNHLAKIRYFNYVCTMISW